MPLSVCRPLSSTTNSPEISRWVAPVTTTVSGFRATKGAGSRTKSLLMAFKLLDMAQQRWRRLDGASLLPLVRVSRSAALFEVKSAFVPDAWVSGTPQEYVQGLRRKYGVTQEDGVKGVGQLARFVSAITATTHRLKELDGIEQIIPVLLVYDPLLDAPLHTEFLAQEFTTALAPDRVLTNGTMKKGDLQIANLVVMTVDELENLTSTIFVKFTSVNVF
jgi:hypothetical protein